MKVTSYTLKSIAVICIFLQTFAYAQQRTGNIVEYFGKEKIEEISEGKLIHVFNKGLALTMVDPNFNSSSFPKDLVFEKFLMNPSQKISNGQVFDLDYQGEEIKWRAINTDKTNTFNDPSLRSSYVYLTYNSSSEQTVIFEASGHSLVLINGYPHEGDHYDFGWNLIPIKLKKGTNTFVLKVGRFPRVRARILLANKPVQFTLRDLTMPDLLLEETKTYKGAIRVINTTESWIKDHTVVAELGENSEMIAVPAIPPMSVRKIAISIPTIPNSLASDIIEMDLQLRTKSNLEVDDHMVRLFVKSKYKHHKKTFISDIDGSVQYYSVAPSSNKNANSQALFLSVHGASVEAVNQANAYKQKNWGHLVAPTNRRPFGFAWEDWGRLDALEVLKNAKNIYKPDPTRIYLTGHSMGGHGTWYLGATYPDYFAAIAPCAGYPDLLGYRDGFLKRRLKMPLEQLARMGITEEMLNRLKNPPLLTPVEEMITRAGTPSRTLKLIRNYLHHGVYVLHGEKDNVVPTYLARDMRKRLGRFHNDFTYYEYPDGTHWYGDHSVDWPPIFEFFKQRTIKPATEIKKLEFSTGSPGVSANSKFITIHQQVKPFEISGFNFSKEDSVSVETNNIEVIQLDLTQLKDTISHFRIDKTDIAVSGPQNLYLKKNKDSWGKISAPSFKEKGPHRNGGFKDAFRNNVVFVYGTKGNSEEDLWYYNRAKFDAETFWYRANGSVEIVKDIDFKLSDYPDRNVVVYGNSKNNAAWKLLLKNSPIQVGDNVVNFGKKELKGDQWGLYFIVPRADSDIASIGVVTASGSKGMKASYMNHYLVNGTTFPDVTLFDNSVLKEGMSSVKCAGFFGNDWSISNGDFKWK